MTRVIEKRIEKLEGSMGNGDAPTCIFALRCLEDDEIPKLLANWREEVAAGRASLTGNALIVRGHKYLTTQEWLDTVRREKAVK